MTNFAALFFQDGGSNATSIQDWTYLVGLVLGSLIIVTALAGWFFKARTGAAIWGLMSFGVVLVCLSLWSSLSISFGPLQAQMDTLRNQLVQVTEVTEAVSNEVASVAEISAGTQEYLTALSDSYARRDAEFSSRARTWSREVQTRKIDLESLTRDRVDFEALKNQIKMKTPAP